MTENKPIMIDGVDVSGCKKLDREYAPNYPEIGGCDWFNECKETSTDCQGRNCLFKQLTRKTQECEELKDKIKYMEEYTKTVEKARDELERENKFSNEQAEQKLEKIEKISKDFHYAIIPFHRGINHEMADRIDYYLNQILQIIDEVK